MNASVAVLLACLCLAAQASASIFKASLGACPKKAAVVQNFDAASYMGKWYEIEAYPQIWELGGKCSTAEYTLDSQTAGRVLVKNSMKSLLGTTVTQEGYADVTSDNGDAELLVTFDVPIVGKRQANYWVLSTDYANHALVYSCTDVAGFFKLEFAWILSRKPTLEGAAKNNVEDAIKAANLDRSAFKVTSQDCDN